MTTKDIEVVLGRVRKWPRARQRDAARMLLSMERGSKQAYRLTDAQIKEVKQALKEADRGKFATAAQMRALWKKCGL